MTSDTSIPNFGKYSKVYDLLYRDKNYAAEADYVTRTLRLARPETRNILELGSGTGRHGRLLAAKGFNVHGIERSSAMMAMAKSAAAVPPKQGSFHCEQGDVRTVVLERRFDAVLALFHVVSYQTTVLDLTATFTTAARHLVPNGVFLFDVWHGPAVLAQQPELRVKTVSDDALTVTRVAKPEIDTQRAIVRVTYDIECRDRHSDEVLHFSEVHVMRYLFPTEIMTIASSCGLQVVNSEEFISGAPPSPSSWSVIYLLRKLPAA